MVSWAVALEALFTIHASVGVVINPSGRLGYSTDWMSPRWTVTTEPAPSGSDDITMLPGTPFRAPESRYPVNTSPLLVRTVIRWPMNFWRSLASSTRSNSKFCSSTRTDPGAVRDRKLTVAGLMRAEMSLKSSVEMPFGISSCRRSFTRARSSLYMVTSTPPAGFGAVPAAPAGTGLAPRKPRWR